MSSNKILIPDDELMRVRDILIKTAADKRSVTKEDFLMALAERNLQMDDHRLSYHIRMAELSGILCSGDLLPMKATYALAADKVKSSVKMEREEVLAHFTRKYFPYDGTICGNWSPYKEECQMEFFNGDYISEDTKEAWIRFRNYKQS